MYEGKVIKFYRELAGITQEQLGHGICSTTHISKIERGLTEYSSEITDMLAKKLDINIEKEVRKLTEIKEKLDMWHEMIISFNMQAAADLQKELASNQLIEISDYKTLYYLLSLKYSLKQGNLTNISKQLKKLPKNQNNLPPYEQNLYKHVMGIYQMIMENHPESIQILKKIDFDKYTNALVFYDLATAYHYNNSPVLAYYYAEKALQLYKQKNYFLGIIDAENLMIIQIESNQYRDFKETKEKYQTLLNLCDLCHSPDRKAKLLHNFAYENLRRQKYVEALRLYEQSMALKEKETGIYLLSLEGYIRTGWEGNLLSQEELLKHVHDGLLIAKKVQDNIYTIVLTIHKYSILQREEQYYKYIATKALPYFREHGHLIVAERYEKELFHYYTRVNEIDRALQTAGYVFERIGK
ncbi:helix-turn-helix domain-containing protein [Paucisalibacillus sp. EB02]|uniref:helix-turn-helix domain-containing protein n=1 Tax=Paucisalibacillus sp. EB02 TaxID=1347087 RepID=UPI0004B19315|nr:helix-turn-helix transcriptional regulator [Paucisalibacillus sp. EB02]